ncbi:MAG: GTP pyrophosphokinase family protein, partial [Mogibacterium sp.]|nr:GTP pyrophosphokinase family protein [Mogibacterium sp.]
NLLLAQEDIEMIRVKDYCDKPKESGYRSMHVVVAVPVYLVNKKKIVPVEIQFRSVMMDAWASLEHELRYKNKGELSQKIVDTLKECALDLHDVDEKMSRIRHEVLKGSNKYSDY